jgi:hypothetical protein
VSCSGSKLTAHNSRTMSATMRGRRNRASGTSDADAAARGGARAGRHRGVLTHARADDGGVSLPLSVQINASSFSALSCQAGQRTYSGRSTVKRRPQVATSARRRRMTLLQLVSVRRPGFRSRELGPTHDTLTHAELEHDHLVSTAPAARHNLSSRWRSGQHGGCASRHEDRSLAQEQAVSSILRCRGGRVRK